MSLRRLGSHRALLHSRNASAAVEEFDPLTITNLRHYWDVSNAATVTLSGSDIVTVTDQTTASPINLTQATSGQRPDTSTSLGTNGLTCADISSASADHLYTASNASYDNVSWMGVIKHKTILVAAGAQFMFNHAPFYELYYFTDGEYHLYDGADLDTGFAADTNPHVVVCIFESGAKKLYIDGTLRGSNAVGATTNIASTYISVGYFKQSATTPSNMLFGELAVVSGVVSEADRLAYQTYAAAKWGGITIA